MCVCVCHIFNLFHHNMNTVGSFVTICVLGFSMSSYEGWFTKPLGGFNVSVF